MMFGGAVLLTLAVLAWLQPLLLIVPFSLIAGWLGIALLIQAYHLHGSAQNGTASKEINDKIETPMRPGGPSDELTPQTPGDTPSPGRSD